MRAASTFGKHRSARRRRGFSLLELLIAIALGVVIMTLAAQVFSAAIAGRDRLTGEGARLAEERRAFDIISRDLHSAIVPPDDSGLQFGLTSTGASIGTNVLQFASVVGEPILAQRAANETALIQYSIIEDPRTQVPGLWRFETPYPVPDGSTPGPDNQETRKLCLMQGVDAVSYTFYSATDAQWVQSWDQQTGLPTAIRLDLGMRDLRDLQKQRTDATALRQVSWTFSLPASLYANDQANEAANAAANQPSTGSGNQ